MEPIYLHRNRADLIEREPPKQLLCVNCDHIRPDGFSGPLCAALPSPVDGRPEHTASFCRLMASMCGQHAKYFKKRVVHVPPTIKVTFRELVLSVWRSWTRRNK